MSVDRPGEFDDLAEDSLDDVSGRSFAPQPLGVYLANLDEVGYQELDLA